MTDPTPSVSDFAPCRCDDTLEIVVTPLSTVPHGLHGDVWLAYCRRCGDGAPFISYGWRGENVTPRAIEAWNAKRELDAARRDAGRYRFVRDRLASAEASTIVRVGPDGNDDESAEVDRIIDAAMGATHEG